MTDNRDGVWTDVPDASSPYSDAYEWKPVADLIAAAGETLTRPRFHTHCGETHKPGPCNDGVTRPAAGVYASDPDAFTEPWYQRRAAAYADDARKIVATVREYEDVHPHDAPCLAPLVDTIRRVDWRGHE